MTEITTTVGQYDAALLSAASGFIMNLQDDYYVFSTSARSVCVAIGTLTETGDMQNCTYYNLHYSSSDIVVSTFFYDSLRLNHSGYLVYSNRAGYPALRNERNENYEKVLCFSAAVALLLCLIFRIFKHVS